MQDAALERRTMARITWRLIPFLWICYLSAYLNRVNVGFAKLQMVADLGFSDQVYGLGAGIFFIGYFLFEVPSNLILERVGARVWIARIMIVWSLVSLATMLVSSATHFYLARFFLGVAEAGFFPGIIVYLTAWFPRAYRSRTIAMFMTAAVFSSVVGSPLSGWLIEMNGVLGMRGWKWLFAVEALPALVLGVAVLLWLPAKPRDARWLAPEQLAWLDARMEADRAELHTTHPLPLGKALTDPRVLLLCAVYLSNCVGGYGLDFFQPTLVRDVFPHASLKQIGTLAAIPQLLCLLVMIAYGRSSDRRQERRKHFALGTLVAAGGLFVASRTLPPWASLAAMTIAVCGRWSVIAPFWGFATSLLSGTAAAGAIALINSVGNLGGFVGPYLNGWLGTKVGLPVLSAIMSLGAVLVMRVAGPGPGPAEGAPQGPAEGSPQGPPDRSGQSPLALGRGLGH